MEVSVKCHTGELSYCITDCDKISQNRKRVSEVVTRGAVCVTGTQPECQWCILKYQMVYPNVSNGVTR